jgi:hypothetical protein
MPLTHRLQTTMQLSKCSGRLGTGPGRTPTGKEELYRSRGSESSGFGPIGGNRDQCGRVGSFGFVG